MVLVVIESPFGTRPDGSRCTPEEVAENVAYLRRCLRDSLLRGEAPFASHALYPQVLDDGSETERKLGILAGFAWGARADLVAVYSDRGVTAGMLAGMSQAIAYGLPVQYRSIEKGASL